MCEVLREVAGGKQMKTKSRPTSNIHSSKMCTNCQILLLAGKSIPLSFQPLSTFCTCELSLSFLVILIFLSSFSFLLLTLLFCSSLFSILFLPFCLSVCLCLSLTPPPLSFSPPPSLSLSLSLSLSPSQKAIIFIIEDAPSCREK